MPARTVRKRIDCFCRNEIQYMTSILYVTKNRVIFSCLGLSYGTVRSQSCSNSLITDYIVELIVEFLLLTYTVATLYSG
jgi:hypothetical protein